MPALTHRNGIDLLKVSTKRGFNFGLLDFWYPAEWIRLLRIQGGLSVDHSTLQEPRPLVSYLGLAPRVRASGGHVRTGGVTKDTNKDLMGPRFECKEEGKRLACPSKLDADALNEESDTTVEVADLQVPSAC